MTCARYAFFSSCSYAFSHQPVDGVQWPKGLEQLLFGRVFNQQIQGTVWASGLRLLALGDFFDQALTGVAWPQNLEFLSLGNKFNQVCVCVCVSRSVWSQARKGPWRFFHFIWAWNSSWTVLLRTNVVPHCVGAPRL